MSELTLSGLSPDGEYLELRDAQGGSFTLPVTDELRAAIRRDRSHWEQLRAGSQPLRPADIQTMLRAGTPLEDVAELAGLPISHIERYDGPIAAEREWAIQQARELPIGHHVDSPTLGDLVIDRLATREVDVASLAWSAARDKGRPWEVSVTFPAGGREAVARWEVDLTSRSLHALDDEARWLSETDVSSPRGRRMRPSIVTELVPESRSGPVVESEPPVETAPVGTETDAILADLASSRGVRQPLEDALFDEDGELLAEPGEDTPQAAILPLRPAGSAASPASGGSSAPTPPLPSSPSAPSPEEAQAPAPAETQPAAPARAGRKGRRSVPSWDEIVFGSKND